MDNLSSVFGRDKDPAEIRRMSRRVFIGIVFMLFEFGWLLRCSPQELSARIRVEGLEHLRAAAGKGRGVLVLTGHLGNWEVLVNAAAMLGYPMNVVYRPMGFPALDLFFRQLRAQSGARLLPKKRAMREILRSLDRRELVGILLDQHAKRSEGVTVDFFGRPASTNRGVALAAMRTGAPVVPMFLVREKGAYRMIICPEVPLAVTGDREQDVKINTLRYTRALESVILRCPEQWFWVHRRWGKRPALKETCTGRLQGG